MVARAMVHERKRITQSPPIMLWRAIFGVVCDCCANTLKKMMGMIMKECVRTPNARTKIDPDPFGIYTRHP